jgi:hypothetical protein
MKNKIQYALLITVLLTIPLAITASASSNSEYTPVDLQYLSSHMEEFDQQKIQVSGTVTIRTSEYMYEDFWLTSVIPVVIRIAGLPMPSEGDHIEIYGTVEYAHIEGGFYYLRAEGYTIDSIPEFSQTLITPIFMAATLLWVIVYRKLKGNRF